MLVRLLIISFMVSAIAGWFVLRWQHLHARFSSDTATAGSHKIHATSVPRIGGIGILVGWTAGLFLAVLKGFFSATEAVFWFLCIFPVFAAGLTEDITKSVPPLVRLLFSFVSAAMAVYLLDALVPRLDLPGVDALFTLPLIAFLFTMFSIGGVAHSVNIIDGLNGLASSICLVAFAALAYVAFKVGDSQIIALSAIGLGALLGFYIWNYPSGQIFCGDGGAYFLGCYVAMLSVLLVARHEQVSAWFPLVVMLYPVWETLFSAYRRKFLRGSRSTQADRLHLHTLLYKRISRRVTQMAYGPRRSRRNSDATVFLALFSAANAIPAVLWWNNTPRLMMATFFFVLAYLVIYKSIVRFKLGKAFWRASPIGYAKNAQSQPVANEAFADLPQKVQ